MPRFPFLAVPVRASAAFLMAAQANLGLLQPCEMARSTEQRQSRVQRRVAEALRGSATLDGRDRKWIRARGQTVGGDESGRGEQRRCPVFEEAFPGGEKRQISLKCVLKEKKKKRNSC